MGVFVGDVASKDPFGRLRTVNAMTRADSTFTYDTQPLLFDGIATGTGAESHDADLRAVYLSTGGTADEAGYRKGLHYYVPYTPGHGQLIFLTGTMNPDGIGLDSQVAEIGYGDLSNGVGFKYKFSTGKCYAFLRSSISGEVIDEEVAQDDWTASGMAFDWTKSQIFAVDFQSLTVGRIRYLLDRGGNAKVVAEIENDNLRTGPYWQLASLPPYWRIYNDGAAQNTGRMLAVCMTVKSEGGAGLFDLNGFPFGVDNSVAKTVSTTEIPLLSIRVATTFNSLVNRMLVLPKSVESYSSAQPVKLRIYLNASLTDANFQAVHGSSGVQWDEAATAVSGGRQVGKPIMLPGGQRGGVSAVNLGGRVPLSLNLAGTTGDILTITGQRMSTSDSDVQCGLGWEEVRG